MQSPFHTGKRNPWKFRCLYWLTICLFSIFTSRSQTLSYNFRHVTTSDGLSNGVIRSITQDKYGYTWIATLNGLCRYNGYSVKVFFHNEHDTTSPPDNFPLFLFTDSTGNLWIAFQKGLYSYQYRTNRFELLQTSSGFFVRKMVQTNPRVIYCATQKGLAVLNPVTKDFSLVSGSIQVKDSQLINRNSFDLAISKNAWIYICTDTGLVVFQPQQQLAERKALPTVQQGIVEKIMIDHNNNLWMNFGDNFEFILKTDAAIKNFTVIPRFLFNESIPNNHVYSFFNDNRNRIWIATSGTGLCLYDSLTGSFTHFGNNPLDPTSISSFNINAIYQDKQGFIWAGTEGYGVNYFNPDDNLFYSILPNYNQSLILSDYWSRAVAEDNDGNFWFGGVTGVAKRNRENGTYTLWQNVKDHPRQLYSNSIRSLLYDDHGYTWVGTAQGLNRYDPYHHKMEFMCDKNEIPFSFYWALMQDSKKNIWIGCRDGLYRYRYDTKKFSHLLEDSLLASFCNYNFISFFEDSRKRIWMGTFRRGVIMYDEVHHLVKHWMKTETDTSFINNNIRSFAEDKSGIIWIASNEGLACFDPVTEKFKKYTREQGLATLNVSELMVDGYNRLWMGTGKGLFMLDTSRQHFRSFSLKDGLLSLEFNEQSAFQSHSGEFIYPALKGFLVFNPLKYKEQFFNTDVHISSFKVFNKEYIDTANTEEVTDLGLHYDENFFSFELTAINYKDPEQTWYAYKLEPFDKSWIYSRDRMVNYTNVPGGDYTFQYKASADPANWNVAASSIAVHIGTVFYKTTLFWILMGILLVAGLYGIYKYRLDQDKKIFRLKTKAQALEKEKAVVQYESLKQQLNPHFLFNSLTSLRSLIRIDKQNAADFLDKMSMNYRYILKSSENELVALKDELAFAQGYTEMQRTRFGNGLQLTVDVSDDHRYKKIVPVTIQNLIENALKHNLVDDENPLLIEIFENEGYLVVRNNLQPKESVEASNRIGLKHLESFYRHITGRPVIISKDEKHFNIKIPLI